MAPGGADDSRFSADIFRRDGGAWMAPGSRLAGAVWTAPGARRRLQVLQVQRGWLQVNVEGSRRSIDGSKWSR